MFVGHTRLAVTKPLKRRHGEPGSSQPALWCATGYCQPVDNLEFGKFRAGGFQQLTTHFRIGYITAQDQLPAMNIR